jgi:hypothetical protein
VIQFKGKTKISKKPKAKSARRKTSPVPRRPIGYFALTPEEVVEMNMFGLAAAQSVVASHDRKQTELKSKKTAKVVARPRP